MKNKLMLIACFCLLLIVETNAQIINSATDLPKISVIGNFVGESSKSEGKFNLKELEFSFQNYIYPSIKADIFVALHKEDSGERNLELEEGFVTFLDVYSLINPDSTLNLGLGMIIGQKFLNIGKNNSLHPEQWQFIDRPLVLQQFLGGEESLSGEGIQLSYLLPLPFFSQIELGSWAVNAHEEENASENHSEIEYEKALFTGRLWNSFSLSDTKELEIGTSILISNFASQSQSEKIEVAGVDFTYTSEYKQNKRLKIQAEAYQANYAEEGEARNLQIGAFVSSVFRFSKRHEIGLRYDYLGKHGDEGENQNNYALAFTRQLSETSKFRLQYITGENTEGKILAQFIFGMGPHAHVLQ